MTREEAITKIKSFCHDCEKFPTCVNTDKECFKSLEMAIEALSAEPCGDCISRVEVLKIIDFEDKWLFDIWYQGNLCRANIDTAFSGLRGSVKDLPSIQPINRKQEEINQALWAENETLETEVEKYKKAIKALEQEPILNKIRAEIDAESAKSFGYPNWERAKALEWVLSIIDKYKESEG